MIETFINTICLCLKRWKNVWFLPWEKFTKLENVFEMDKPTVCNFQKWKLNGKGYRLLPYVAFNIEAALNWVFPPRNLITPDWLVPTLHLCSPRWETYYLDYGRSKNRCVILAATVCDRYHFLQVMRSERLERFHQESQLVKWLNLTAKLVVFTPHHEHNNCRKA